MNENITEATEMSTATDTQLSTGDALQFLAQQQRDAKSRHDVRMEKVKATALKVHNNIEGDKKKALEARFKQDMKTLKQIQKTQKQSMWLEHKVFKYNESLAKREKEIARIQTDMDSKVERLKNLEVASLDPSLNQHKPHAPKDEKIKTTEAKIAFYEAKILKEYQNLYHEQENLKKLKADTSPVAPVNSYIRQMNNLKSVIANRQKQMDDLNKKQTKLNTTKAKVVNELEYSINDKGLLTQKIFQDLRLNA